MPVHDGSKEKPPDTGGFFVFSAFDPWQGKESDKASNILSPFCERRPLCDVNHKSGTTPCLK
jgi:hypothetical protein